MADVEEERTEDTPEEIMSVVVPDEPLPPAVTSTELVAQPPQDAGDFLMPVVDKFLQSASTLILDEAEIKALEKDIADEDIEIRPDGLIYPGWHWCANRMDNVFGPGAWVLTPLSLPKLKKNIIYAPYSLHVKGKFVGYAIGEQAYYANNGTMTYGDACEGAKSNALLRLCKPLIPGMRKMWNKRFIEGWKMAYAEAYESGGRVLWRKKGDPPDGSNEFEFLSEMARCKKHAGSEKYYKVLKSLGFDKANKVKNPKKRIAVLTIMRSQTQFNPYKED